jgi:hypothetical protein
MTTFYLGGPMRGFPRYNFDAFEEAYQDLTQRGFTVISPHKMDVDLGFDPDKDEYKGEFVPKSVLRDVEGIIKSDGVVFLPGWTKSTGAMAEYHVAKWLEKPCFMYPELTQFQTGRTIEVEELEQKLQKKNILEEANHIIHGARQESYGHPKLDFARTAKMWEAVLGSEVKPEQVALCMICVKLSRLCNAYKRDSVIDIAGYAGTLEMVHES